jgi:hypothetical protein
MAKNLKPQMAAAPKASAPKVNQTIGTRPIKTFKGPSLKGSHVGPKNAPYYEK